MVDPAPVPIPRIPAQCTVTKLCEGRWLAYVTSPESDIQRIYTLVQPSDNEAAKEALRRYEEEYPHGRSGHTAERH